MHTTRRQHPAQQQITSACRAFSAVLAIVFAAGSANAADAQAALQRVDQAGGWASTHIIVKLKPSFIAVTNDIGQARFEREVHAPGNERTQEQLDAVNLELARRNVTAMSPARSRPAAHAERAQRIGLDRYHIVRVPEGSDTLAFANRLAHFNDIFESAQVDPIGGVAELVPSDPEFDEQYALKNTGQSVAGSTGIAGADVKATFAWDITTGTDDLIIAIVDSGVDDHPDLAGRLIPGADVFAGDGLPPGEPVIYDTSDTCDHGTHMAGIAAANGDDGFGIAGMDWNVRIMPIRILAGCSGPESDLADGIVLATDLGADVISMSLQYSGGTDFLHDAVLYARDMGKVLVAASGNFGFSGGVAFPGRFEETITVAATNNADERWFGSNPGPEVTVAAPGDDIYSLSWLTSAQLYDHKSGTSMATPHVSALATLMLSVDPTLTHDDIRQLLIDSAHDVESPGFDTFTGHGRIDAHAALLAVEDQLAGDPDLSGDGTVGPADLAIVLGNWGPCPVESDCPADLSGDGVVGPSDLAIVLGNWG